MLAPTIVMWACEGLVLGFGFLGCRSDGAVGEELTSHRVGTGSERLRMGGEAAGDRRIKQYVLCTD